MDSVRDVSRSRGERVSGSWSRESGARPAPTCGGSACAVRSAPTVVRSRTARPQTKPCARRNAQSHAPPLPASAPSSPPPTRGPLADSRRDSDATAAHTARTTRHRPLARVARIPATNWSVRSSHPAAGTLASVMELSRHLSRSDKAVHRPLMQMGRKPRGGAGRVGFSLPDPPAGKHANAPAHGGGVGTYLAPGSDLSSSGYFG